MADLDRKSRELLKIFPGGTRDAISWARKTLKEAGLIKDYELKCLITLNLSETNDIRSNLSNKVDEYCIKHKKDRIASDVSYAQQIINIYTQIIYYYKEIPYCLPWVKKTTRNIDILELRKLIDQVVSCTLLLGVCIGEARADILQNKNAKAAADKSTDMRRAAKELRYQTWVNMVPDIKKKNPRLSKAPEYAKVIQQRDKLNHKKVYSLETITDALKAAGIP